LPAVFALLVSALTAAVTPNATLTADQAAVRFLNQATFGASPTSLAELQALNYNYSAWITQEAAKPETLAMPLLQAARLAGVFTTANNPNMTSSPSANRAARNQIMLAGSDQLRQRMAYALSQIVVISDQDSAIQGASDGSTSYYDMLVRNALGNYRTLLMDVTRHPMMGRYLSHYKNRKANTTSGTRPDENYAREIMQLFTIGLYNLNADGTPIVVNGRQVESYTNEDITEFARVFTGFTDESSVPVGSNPNADFPNVPSNNTTPMRMWQPQHDVGAKRLLAYSGATKANLPANQPGLTDVQDAINNLIEHPNTAPFICRQLIQRLVTSNPSAAYVGRVAAVFVNNGSGVRGDLLAVARAILTDNEARNTTFITNAQHGKLREPFLRVTALLRAYRFSVTHPTALHLLHDFGGFFTQTNLGQYPLSSPSVFNFYSPDFEPAGALANANLVGPEFQILNSVFAVTTPNAIYNLIQTGASLNFRIDLTEQTNLAATPASLLDNLNLMLCGGTMSAETRTAILAAVNGVTQAMAGTSTINQTRARLAIYLTAISPDCAVQK
jgi:uncharacterized protein (DUF1800 family)